MRYLTALTIFAALTTAAPGAPAATPRPVATVKVLTCERGTSAEERRATFRSAMRRIRGTARMWMKFVLEERVGGPAYRTVAAPGLGVWRKSRPGVRRFAVRQRVLELAEGAAYRVVVRYRWYDADGAVIRRARRRSAPCRQPGPLPNLRVGRIGAKREGATARYAIDVVNRGRAGSSPTSVAVSVDGDVIDTPAVGPLAPGESRRVFVNGPSCAASVSARVDPTDAVRESAEGDNARAVPCPA